MPKKLSKMKRSLLITGLVALVLGAVAGVVYAVNPLLVSGLQSKTGDYLAGIRNVPFGKNFRALERNHCPSLESQNPLCECILLIHGAGDEPGSWRRILRDEAKSWVYPVRLLAVGLPGVAGSKSTGSSEDYRSSSVAHALVQSLIEIEQATDRGRCGRYTVVGNSFGGAIAMWMALEEPNRVKKLVLVGSVGTRLAEVASAETRKLLLDPTVLNLKEFQKRAYHYPRDIPEHVWAAISLRAKRNQAKTKGLVESLKMDESRKKDFLDERLAQIKQPTLVFWGASDRVTPREVGREMSLKIKGSQYREAEFCGHLPQKECPNALRDALNGWLRYGAM